MSRGTESKSESKYDNEQSFSYLFNASCSHASLSFPTSFSTLDGEIKIKRSSSYVYDLDGSSENLDNAESLFGSAEMASVPNLNYFVGDEVDNEKDNPPRCASAGPDFFHGSPYDDNAVSYVNLSSFVKNQSDLYQSLLTKTPVHDADNLSKHVTCDSHPTFTPKANKSMEPIVEARDTKPLTETHIIPNYSFTNNCEYKVGTCSQTSPYDIEMELLVIPMVNNPSQVELRIPYTSLPLEKKKVLKRIALENELTILNIGKKNSRYIVLRKKATLIQRQVAQRKAEEEAEREKQRVIEEAKLAVDSQVTSESGLCVASIQTSISAASSQLNKPPQKTKKTSMGKTKQRNKEIESCTTEVVMNSAARRKARRAAEREKAEREAAALRAKERRRRETAMQTCPPDWLICPWCRQDIPPKEQCGHIGLCRAAYHQRKREAQAKEQLQNHRLAVENARRRKKNLPPLNIPYNGGNLRAERRGRNHSRSISRRQNSHSRTRSVEGNVAAAVKKQAVLEAQLKDVHPNDVNGMLHATQRICAQANCPRLITSTTGGTCAYCRLTLCPHHRPPHTGHCCPTAPKPGTKNRLSNGQMEVACGEEVATRQAILKQRMRERLYVMAERRRR